jgi:hypothetical protein
MLVIIAICIILIIIGDYLGRKDCDYEGRCLAFLIPGVGVLVLSAIVYVVLVMFTIECNVINQKIEILKENNAQIEEKLQEAIDIYCEYEDDNFDNFQNPETIFLVFPELKANTLFQTYMLTLQENKKEITELQLKKAYESTYKWLLYFGS